MTTEIETKEGMELITQDAAEKQAINLTDQAKALVIVTNEDRINAETLLENLSSAEKQIFAYLDPPRAKAYEDWQYHKKRLDDAIGPIKQARKDAKEKTMAWDDEQKRKHAEAQDVAEAAARKRAEDDALAAALQAEQEGDKETADAILSEPITAPPVVVPKTAPAASRLSAGRSVWSAVVFSVVELCRAVANGVVPVEYVMGLTKNKDTGVITSPALNLRATSDKTMFRVPGVRAVERKV